MKKLDPTHASISELPHRPSTIDHRPSTIDSLLLFDARGLDHRGASPCADFDDFA
ncbi:MAG: hypothetical protein MUF54_11490 [Polyangiaceae bacterium]|jgi:hypothetical protein|nr:hypothetical protein [Polyangiaceae bacterium]